MPRLYTSFRKAAKSAVGKKLTRVAPVNWAYHALLSRWTQSIGFVEISGHKIFLDRHDDLGLLMTGQYEKATTDFVQQEINAGDVVLDIGAHIGYYTLLFAKLVGEDGRVFAFEPEPNAFGLLHKNVLTNGYKNVTLVQKAVSDRSSTMSFGMNRSSIGGEVAASRPGQRQRLIAVNATRLDEYFRDFGRRISFIKMDIEGSEYPALEGARDLLQRNEQVTLVMEFNPAALMRGDVDPRKYLSLIQDLGFEMYNISEKLEPIGDLEGFAASITGIATANLLCRRH